MIEPPVCEPIAPRHMPHASAAAEPLLLPPGVRAQAPRVARRRRVEAGVLRRHRLAEEHRPRLAQPPHRRRVLPGHAVLPQPRAGRRRPVEHVEDVFNPDGDSVQRAAPVAARISSVPPRASSRAPSRSTNTQAWTRPSRRSMRSRQASRRSRGAARPARSWSAAAWRVGSIGEALRGWGSFCRCIHEIGDWRAAGFVPLVSTQASLVPKLCFPSFPNSVWERLPRNSVSRPVQGPDAKQSFALSFPNRSLGTRGRRG